MSNNNTEAFQFSGKGSEYFRIWIVNLALTLLTLGIYSAWAKVRRLQYFYRHTALGGSSFDYHGDPVAILKGRIIAVALLVIYNVAGNMNPLWGLVAFVVLLIVLPWLIQRSLQFKLHNSSYRGLRFSFGGSNGQAYKNFLLWPLAGYFTLGLLAPLAHQRVKAYQHNSSHYGTEPFFFSARAKQFYKIYLKLLGLVLIMLIVLAGSIAMGMYGLSSIFSGELDVKSPKHIFGIFVIVLMFYLLAFLFIGPWFAARTQNLVWNHTALGQNPFSSHVRARDLFWLYLTNFIAIILTLGLFKPFADIRLARYRLEHMAMHPQTSLDDIHAGQSQATTATGEESADLFDFDISF
ncbi:MAG: YjgN family protein [Thiobacillus sp.]